jgi:hypothetical protein
MGRMKKVKERLERRMSLALADHAHGLEPLIQAALRRRDRAPHGSRSLALLRVDIVAFRFDGRASGTPNRSRASGEARCF